MMKNEWEKDAQIKPFMEIGPLFIEGEFHLRQA